MPGALVRRLSTLAGGALSALFLAIVALLLGIALISTCFITSDWTEFTFFVADGVVAGLGQVVLMLALAAGVALAARMQAMRRLGSWLAASNLRWRLCEGALIVLACALAVGWILVVKRWPQADQLFVQDSVAHFLAGDYQDFVPGGYLDLYPQQVGLFWLSCGLALVFGPGNYLALQLVNVIALALILHELCELGGFLGLGRAGQLATVALGFAFVPLIQYANFVYGTLWGLALALAGLRRELAFLDRRRARDLIAAALLLGLATMVKGNYAVFLIAGALYALLRLGDGAGDGAATDVAAPRAPRHTAPHGARQAAAHATSTTSPSRDTHGSEYDTAPDGSGLFARTGWAVGATLVSLVAAYLLQAQLPLVAARMATGEAMDQGASSWSWLVMGAQESPLAPGWYNGYNNESYHEAGFDSAVQAERNRADLADAYARFAAEPAYAAEFFLKKIASQWNNPGFEGSWISQVMPIAEGADDAGPLARELLSPVAADALIRRLDLLHLFVLAGTLLWAATQHWDRQDALRTVVYPLAFIGGFVCHVFWEAKCQYALPYYVLLLPMALAGWHAVGELAAGAIVSRLRRSARRMSTAANTRRITHESSDGTAGRTARTSMAAGAGRSIPESARELSDASLVDARHTDAARPYGPALAMLVVLALCFALLWASGILSCLRADGAAYLAYLASASA